LLPNVRTLDGMQRLLKEEQLKNTLSSISLNREPLSNVTVFKLLHPSKHLMPNFSTLDGRQILRKEEQL
jgi:hypothetical protein